MVVENKSEIVTPPKGRLIWGGIVFVSGFLAPLLIPWVLTLEISTSMKSIISGLLALGVPELFMLIAVGILGKDGFQYLKKSIFGWFRKYGPPETVSKTRYIIGLILFSSSILQGLVLPYVWEFVPVIKDNMFYVLISGDVILVLSLFVLGGDFWDKLRSLFVYRSRAILMDKPQQNS
ncbi:MAG: hypothetical protein QM503_13795 [Bacteroidota bacterium]